VFVRVLEVLPTGITQNEDVLKPWIDPHQLKQHQGAWYKDGRTVVTGQTQEKHEIIHNHHDYMDTQVSVK
jgi:hypothetical protein